jgi:outer membrane autotransporter protein
MSVCSENLRFGRTVALKTIASGAGCGRTIRKGLLWRLLLCGAAMGLFCTSVSAQLPGAINQATINGATVGKAIAATCPGGANGASSNPNNQAFQSDCNDIANGASGSTLNVLASDQINAQNSAAVRSAGLGAVALQNRLAGIRFASGLPVYGSTTLANNNLSPVPTGGAASSDASFGRFGAFVTAGYVWGSEDPTSFSPGFDINRWSILGGLDYRFTDNLVAGASLRYAHDSYSYDSNRGDMSGNDYSLAVYGTYFLPSGLFFDGLISYGYNDYTLHRTVNYSVVGKNANQTATSTPTADLWNINLGVGYTYYREAWSLTPSLHLNYLENKVDSYNEAMSSPVSSSVPGSSMALGIASQTYRSFVSDLGIQVARAFSLKSSVLQPYLRLSWLHEFENSQQQVGAFFINDINKATTPLFIVTNEPTRDYFNLGVGVSAQFARGVSGFISYDTLLGYSGVTLNAVNVGARFEF